jgi:hypothetical protein
VGPRDGLDGYGKSCPQRDLIPGPSRPYRVVVQTELSRPTSSGVIFKVNPSEVLGHPSIAMEDLNSTCDMSRHINDVCKSNPITGLERP